MQNKLKKLVIKGCLRNIDNRVSEEVILERKLSNATNIIQENEYKNIYVDAFRALANSVDFGNPYLEFIVKALQDAKAKGKNVFADLGHTINETRLYSANVTMEDAYKKVHGETRAEYIEREKAKYGADYYLKLKGHQAAKNKIDKSDEAQEMGQ